MQKSIVVEQYKAKVLVKKIWGKGQKHK